MQTPDEIKNYPYYRVEQLLTKMSKNGKYVVESEIPNVGYVIENGMIGVIAGKDGTLAIDIDKAEFFISELTEILELARTRKTMNLKGA